jgi:hypothetical protein
MCRPGAINLIRIICVGQRTCSCHNRCPVDGHCLHSHIGHSIVVASLKAQIHSCIGAADVDRRSVESRHRRRHALPVRRNAPGHDAPSGFTDAQRSLIRSQAHCQAVRDVSRTHCHQAYGHRRLICRKRHRRTSCHGLWPCPRKAHRHCHLV